MEYGLGAVCRLAASLRNRDAILCVSLIEDRCLFQQVSAQRRGRLTGVSAGGHLTGRHDERHDGQPDERDQDDRHCELIVSVGQRAGN
jgi:hypothetical protein